MSGETTITAAVLVIGDEILSGRTKDRNIGILADYLSAAGIMLREARVVADVESAITGALDALRAMYDYVFTTGGIGPTHDDITAESIAKAFGVPLVEDERAIALMRPYYDARGIELTAARLRMARIPEGASIIANPISAAPGFRIGNVIVLPGIPDTMQAMLESVTPGLSAGPRMLSETLRLARPEGEIADLFAAHQKEHPNVAMGSYPTQFGEFWGCELVLRATNQLTLKKVAQALREKLTHCGLEVK